MWKKKVKGIMKKVAMPLEKFENKTPHEKSPKKKKFFFS